MDVFFTSQIKMNILLFVIQDTYIGGAEGVLHQVAEHYLKVGHHVYVLFYMPKKYGHWEQLENSRLHLYYGGAQKLFSNITSLRKIHFDYSYSSLVDLTGILGILKRLHILHIKKMVGRESTSIFDRFTGFGLWRKKMMYRLGYPAVNVLICQTTYMKERLLQYLPWIEMKSNVVVIPNPVDINTMMLKGEEEIDVAVDYPYIVTAGRFIPEKGYDILIDSFAIIKNEHPGLHLVILGDGDLRDSYKAQVSKYGLMDYIHMPGFSKNVYPWFRKARLCVISSRVEGFPNVLLQMMSQNTNVVSTLCAGDIDKIKGLLTCPPKSVEALANAMEQALSEINIESNRQLFDKELKNRSIENFVKIIETVH